MKLQFLLFASFLVYTKGLLFNSNQTHRPTLEERMDLLEKQLTDERKQKYTLQVEFDQEKHKMAEMERKMDALNETDKKLLQVYIKAPKRALNETDQKLLQVYIKAPKRFQDITTQIRGALLGISSLDNKHSLDIQNLAEGLNDVQALLPNLQSNISAVQRHFQEKGNVISLMIEDIKRNQTAGEEELSRLENTLVNLANSQTTLQSRVTKIEDSVIFIAIGKSSPVWWFSHFYTSSSSYTSSETIKFPVLKLNVGGGYNNNTGVFTSPSEGYYVFHWAVTSINEKHCSSAIAKNGEEIAWSEDGANLATLHLNKYDRTWIKTTLNCTLIFKHSSFYGFKII